MAYLGDIAPLQVLYTSFNTLAVTTAVPATLAGSPVLSCYKDDVATETTTGITLSVDFDSRTGYHKVKIDTADAFYTAGHDYQVVVTAGTVATISIVGTVVCEFSINNRTGLRPTTAGNTIDVSSTGEVGLDFANIKAASSPTTLTNITIPTVTTVGTLTTYTGNTLQTANVATLIGTPSVSVSADIEEVQDAVDTINTSAGLQGAVWNGTHYV